MERVIRGMKLAHLLFFVQDSAFTNKPSAPRSLFSLLSSGLAIDPYRTVGIL